MKYVFDPRAALSTTCIPAIGGKANNLLRLQRQGLQVPTWIALPVDAFLETLEIGALGQRLQALLATLSDDNAERIAEEARTLILETPLPKGLSEELASIDFIARDPLGFVSVRSSSADEDGATHSFAGIHESFLYVHGVDSVAHHVRRVWASGYQERALLYRRANELPLHPVPMAVIIQTMVDAKTSGVAFTADPAAQNPFMLVVSALYGLGEGLVGAGLAADHVRYDKHTHKLDVAVAAKETQFIHDKRTGEGLVEIPVPETLRNAPALSDAQLDRVVRTALQIEQTRRRPQDIEFCFDAAGSLYVLQTRDITTVEDVGPAGGNRQVWDNANIIESYSGVTSPMTFSFIRHAYTVVYHCFSEVMGIPPATVMANRPVFENMLGLVRGQVYYNLMNWYRLIRQFPGYGMNKRFMESMMGLRERFDPDGGEPDTDWARKWLIEFPRVVRLALRMVVRFALLDRAVGRFQSRFHALYAGWEAMDFDELPPHQLLDVYHEMESKLLWNWQAPIINDFYVMMHYGILRTLCRKWCGDETQSLQNDLICGNGDMESTEPTRLLMRLALRIRRNPGWLALFQSKDHHALARLIPSDPACAEIATEINTYLQRYGFRCINELKLEEPSLRETPEFVYQILQNYLAVDEQLLDAEAMAAREQDIRRRAEETINQALHAQSLPGLRRMVFRWVLRNARKGVRNRENMRFARTRIYGVLRELIQAMGRHLVRAGVLDNARDVFHLAIDELWDYVKGTAITTDLRGLADLRRREFDRYRSSDCPPAADHFETNGMVYAENTFRDFKPVTASAEGDLSGTGCCPGEVTAPVRIVRSPRDNLDLNGCILVAGRTDPGWVPLYPAVRGILIERGSILSHSAIVAREMGIPAIVGIHGLLDALSNGQTVTMNGQTGTVRIHPPAVPSLE